MKHLIILLLCLLALKPSIFSQTISVGDSDVTYAGQAAEEVQVSIYGVADFARSAGTVVSNMPPSSTNPKWHSWGAATNLGVQAYDNGVQTGYSNLETVTFTDRVSYLEYQVDLILQGYNDDSEITYSVEPDYSGLFNGETFHLYESQEYVYLIATSEFVTQRKKILSQLNGEYPTEAPNTRVWDQGSLKYNARQEALSLINGLDPVANPEIRDEYSLMDHDNTNYTRNTSFFMADNPFTCISPWNSTGSGGHVAKRGLPSGQFRCATAITPRHILAAYHFHPMQQWSGSDTSFKIRFVTSENEVIERTMTDYYRPYDRGSGYPVWYSKSFSDDVIADQGVYQLSTDYCVIRLDEALPASIVPAQIAPTNYFDYAPVQRGGLGYTGYYQGVPNYPVFVSKAERNIRIGETAINPHGWGQNLSVVSGQQNFMFSPNVALGGHNRNMWYYLYDDLNTEDWYPDASIDGDSGTPAFMVVNGRAIIIGTHTTPSGAWNILHFTAPDIQRQITETWGDPELLDYADLSMFNAYPSGHPDL